MTTKDKTYRELREKLADIEHQRWADWQNYVHRVFLEGNFQEFMLRWQRQINTPYSKLSDPEKASDMEQVDRYWHLIQEHIEGEKYLNASEVLNEYLDSKDSNDQKVYMYGYLEWLKDRIKQLKDKGGSE